MSDDVGARLDSALDGGCRIEREAGEERFVVPAGLRAGLGHRAARTGVFLSLLAGAYVPRRPPTSG